MLRRILPELAAIVCVVALGASACQRIDEGTDPAGNSASGDLQFEDRRFPDAIPADYGDLAGVIPGENGWAALVFQRSDDAIVIIGVDRFRGLIDGRAVVIPRR